MKKGVPIIINGLYFTQSIINLITQRDFNFTDKNRLENASADEVLMGTPNLTDKQREWLKAFIEVWEKAQDVESWLDENEVKDEKRD